MEHSLARREMEPPTVTTMRQLALSCDHPPRVLFVICLFEARTLADVAWEHPAKGMEQVSS